MRMKMAARILAGFGLLCCMIQMPVHAQGQLSAEKIYALAMKSVCWIVVPSPVPNDPTKIRLSTGSGSLIDRTNGLVLTNYHVVDDAPGEALIFFPMKTKQGEYVPDRETYLQNKASAIVAKVLFKDEGRDLALLKITNLRQLPKDSQAVSLGEKSPGPGASVHSLGNPGGAETLWVYTPGTVRAPASAMSFDSGTGNQRKVRINCKMLTTTSPTNKGDSGGPMFNDKGQLIAVTQGGVDPNAASAISYFIDISEVRDFLKNNRVKLTTAPTNVAASNSSEEMPAEGAGDTKEGTPAKKAAPAKDDPAVLQKKAQGKLDLAQTFYDAGKKDRAITYLEEIIRDFPMTNAAKDAKSLLAKWKK